ncbi:MAG TPA: hypothetical protein VFG76_05200, partial [Candidatus Polarisedimenticolia bacterium]|nr:hypothetical protein [Candidatus Polarisedimenticolia bacterium]
GGGKSWCLRRILEQTHGAIQHLVIDPEGEFASLRERFDYVHAAKHGERFRSLYAHLREVLSYTPITHLAYETCYFRSRAQMESHTGFITTIQHFAAVHELDLLAASPVEIKVEAGYGRADKEQMMRAAEKRWSVRPRTHDEADALILLSLAISRLKFKARLAKAASR